MKAPKKGGQLLAAREMLATLLAIQGCPQVAPLLARWSLRDGRSALASLEHSITAAEAAGIEPAP